MILDICQQARQMQNLFTARRHIGTVKDRRDLQGKIDLKVGDKIASLVP